MSKLIFSFLVFHVLICRSYSSVYPKEEDNAKINVIDTSGDGRHESVTSLYHDPQLVSNSLKQSFSEYQVLKVKHDLEKRNQLYQDLDGKVDFWSSHTSGNDSCTTDFLVAPTENLDVKKYLRSHEIPFQIMMSDVELVIETQNKAAEKMSSNQEIKMPRSKRNARHRMRDFLTIMAYGAKTIIKTGNEDDPSDVVDRRADFPYIRIPRKALLSTNDPELQLLDYGARIPRMSWTQYHTLETIYAFMRELEDQYPDLINVIEIGQTFERRPILLAKIAKKNKNVISHTAKRAIFIEAGIHAREWISPATATFIMRELVVNANFNADVLDFYDFYILPVANPDGYAYSHRTNRMWRKNRSPNRGIGALLNPCWGVDLNRNFGYAWGASNIFNTVGGTNLPCLETYSGPKPWSELETRALRDFVLAHKQDIEMYISLHSYGERVMYPWSHSKEKIHDWQELHSIGITIATAIQTISGQEYTVGSGSEMYVTSGGCDDWVRSAGIKWIYLLELPDKEFGFILPPTEILRTAHSIFNGIRAGALEVATTFYNFRVLRTS